MYGHIENERFVGQMLAYIGLVYKVEDVSASAVRMYCRYPILYEVSDDLQIIESGGMDFRAADYQLGSHHIRVQPSRRKQLAFLLANAATVQWHFYETDNYWV